MKISAVKELLPYLFNSNVTPLLWGPQGIGKTELVKQAAKSLGMDVIVLPLGNMEVGDLLGLADFVKDKNGNKVATKFMRPDWFPTDPKSKGILFLDEINRARRDVLQACFPLVLEGRIHKYQLPKGWHIVCAANPDTGDFNVTNMDDKAWGSRFCQIKVTNSVSDWIDFANTQDTSDEIIQFIREQPAMLHADNEDYSLEVTADNRSWMMIDSLYKQKMPHHLFEEASFGLVGSVAAMAFMKSVKNMEKPLTGEEIIGKYLNKTLDEKGQTNREKLLKWAHPLNTRSDLLKASCDNLLRVAAKQKKNLSDKQEKSLVAFLLDLPVEHLYHYARDLYKIGPQFSKVMDTHKEFTTKLQKARADAGVPAKEIT